MTEVAPADRTSLLQSKRAEYSSIAVSRKRKFRELISVAATGDDDVPNRDLGDPDAAPFTPAETKLFYALRGSEILQGRPLHDLSFPARRVDPAAFELFLSKSDSFATEIARPDSPKRAKLSGGNSSESYQASSGDGVLGEHASNHEPKTPASIDNLRPDLAAEEENPGQDTIPSQATEGSGDASERIEDGLVAGAKTSLERVEGNERHANQATESAPAPRSPHVEVVKPSVSEEALQTEPMPDAMDVDDSPELPNDSSGGERQLGSRDVLRNHEAASSPGSTAHSATTPAVHDASTDTSPESGEPQYGDQDDERPLEVMRHRNADVKGDRKRPLEQNEVRLGQAEESSMDSAKSTVEGVEAQLLQQSAAAHLAQQARTTESRELHDRANSTQRNTSRDNSLGDAPGPVTETSHAVVATEGISAPETGAHSGPNAEREAVISQDSPEVATITEPSTSEPKFTHGPATETGNVAAEVTKARDAITPTSEGPPSALNSPSTERPNTFATGFMPQKSVSQIFGEMPRTLPTPSEPAHRDDGDDEEVVPPARLKSRSLKPLDKWRRCVPTVVFGQPPRKAARKAEDDSQVARAHKPGHIPSDDYFTPLFIEGFTKQTPWMKPLEKLLNSAHKTVSTPDQHLALSDHQACKILRRVYHLQQHNKWSLRQPMRCPEPTRPSSHWDLLLREMKWMRTDFREERKWKLALARNLAHACAEWVWASPEERKELQVNAVSPPAPATSPEHAGSAEAIDAVEEAVPDLVFSDSPMDHDEEALATPLTTVAPTAIFGLQDDEVVFGLQRSQAADQLLEELPMYGAPLTIPKADLTSPEFDPDGRWKRPAVPLSKYVEGEMVLATKSHPRKQGRYQYAVEDEDEDDGQVVFGDPAVKGNLAPQSDVKVALFDPEMQTVRDRLHASHQFRPPADLHMPMPPQSFYESRAASQWTLAEDDELKGFVKEYSYNWFLISNMISSRSMFASGPERRTPWECFERWIDLEGIPHDMTKTPYFKAYQNRIGTAQRIIDQHNKAAAQQQANASSAVTPVPRRRQTLTMKVERRRNQKHLAMIDSFRKLAKKRETSAQKAQQAASLAAMRKVNEVPRQQGPNKTPRDYSLMRHERDQQLTERMAQYAQRQQEALQKRQQQAAQARQAHAGPISTPGGAAALPTGPGGQVVNANGLVSQARIGIPNPNAMNGQARPPNSRVQMSNATQLAAAQAQMTAGSIPNLSMNGMPQALSQAAMHQAQAQQHAQAQLAVQAAQVMQAQAHPQAPAQHRMSMGNPQTDINLLIQARRIQDQQRTAVQLQQQQQQQQQHVAQQQHQQPAQLSPHVPQGGNRVQGSPPGMQNMMNGIAHQSFMNNAQAMMASFNAANASSVGTNGSSSNMAGMTSGSPRGQAISHLPVVQQRLRELENHYRVKHPSLPPEHICKLATEHLGRLIVQSQTHAANMSAGGAVAQQAAPNGIAVSSSPHQYAQLLRAQQQAQQQQAQGQGQGGQLQPHPQQQQHVQPHPQQQQQQQAQHQRQSSGSATPVPGK